MLAELMRHTRRGTVPLTLALFAVGCSAAPPPGQVGPAERKVITAEQIQSMGARTAWDVLERAHVHLGFHEDRYGQPVGLSRRGRRSMSSTREPLVIVNGIRTEGSRPLHDILAGDIASIRVITGIRATQLYGTGAGGGAVLIELKGGR